MPTMNAYTRNLFDPFGFWSRALAPSNPDRSGKPIEIDARASDKGMTIRAEQDAVVIKGTAAGPEPVRDMFGLNPMAEYAKSVSFTLDINHTRTTDGWGERDYSEKNSRIFTVMTSKGASAEQIASALARKVNAEDDFKASVQPLADGSVRVSFERR